MFYISEIVLFQFYFRCNHRLRIEKHFHYPTVQIVHVVAFAVRCENLFTKIHCV